MKFKLIYPFLFDLHIFHANSSYMSEKSEKEIKMFRRKSLLIHLTHVSTFTDKMKSEPFPALASAQRAHWCQSPHIDLLRPA